MDDNLFDRPSSDWSDDEIRAGLGVLVAERDVAAARGEASRAERLNELACVLAGERDARARLYAAVEDAVNPFRCLGADPGL